MKKLTICLDFDNTIVKTDNYPHIVGLQPYARNVINSLRRDGHYIIISTCRTGRALGDMIKYLSDNDIQYSAINENNPERVRKYRGDCRKISADIYYDNAAYPQCAQPIDWAQFGAYCMLLANGGAGDTETTTQQTLTGDDE